MAADTLEKLIQKIETKLAESDKPLITLLRNELNKTSQPSPNSHHAVIDTESGCYRFDGDANYYCPNCFDQLQQRVATQRINRQLRVCSQCRASLKPAKK